MMRSEGGNVEHIASSFIHISVLWKNRSWKHMWVIGQNGTSQALKHGIVSRLQIFYFKDYTYICMLLYSCKNGLHVYVC